MQDVARILAVFRKKHGLTQTQLANEIGVGQSTIVRWEKGGEPRPEAWRQLRLYARKLGEEIPSPWDPAPPSFDSGKRYMSSQYLTIIGEVGSESIVKLFTPDETGTEYEDYPVAEIFGTARQSTRAVVVRGSGMKPKFDHGDLLCIADALEDLGSPPFLGYFEYTFNEGMVGSMLGTEEKSMLSVSRFNADSIVKAAASLVFRIQAIYPHGMWRILRDSRDLISKKPRPE
ncbi:hypothetical protein LMIY3S_03665 [Labrys miyagiensis]